MKLCEECRRADHINGHAWECLHPEAQKTYEDFINGGTKTVAPSCQFERLLGKCDVEARNFEPKDGGFV